MAGHHRHQGAAVNRAAVENSATKVRVALTASTANGQRPSCVPAPSRPRTGSNIASFGPVIARRNAKGRSCALRTTGERYWQASFEGLARTTSIGVTAPAGQAISATSHQ